MGAVRQDLTLGVVIVTWNSTGTITRCLAALSDALAAAPAVEARVVVVDNASTDDTASHVQSFHGLDLQLVRVPANLHFAGGTDVGLALVGDCEWLLVLNPDAEVHVDAVSSFARLAAAVPEDVGVLGSTLLDGAGGERTSARPFPDIGSDLLRELLGSTRRRAAIRRERPMEVDASADWAPVPVVTGAAMWLRGEAVAEVGAFDVRYPHTSEDVDLCRRMQAGGWRVTVTGRVRVDHLAHASSKQAHRRTSSEAAVGRYRYYRVHEGRRAAWVYKAAMTTICLVRGVAGTMLALIGRPRAGLRGEYARALDVLVARARG